MQGLKQRLAQRLRPWFKPRLIYDRERWEREYQYGRWDYLRGLEELGHYSIIAGYCKYLRRGGAVLDLGCGEGLLLDALDIGAYSRYVGLDISATAIARAQSRQEPTADFVVGDICAYTPADKFDVIVFNETLYYLPDPVACMRRYVPRLRDHGLFIVSMYLHPKDPLWRKIGEQFAILDSSSVINKRGVEWHCQVLLPESPPNATMDTPSITRG